MAQRTDGDVTYENPTTDDLSRSDADRLAVARLAHELLHDDAVRERLEAVVAERAEELLAAEDVAVAPAQVDHAAVGLLAALAAQNAMNGPYLLRGDAVTVGEADLEAGDTIHMESAVDPDTIIDFVVTDADPDVTEVGVRRIEGSGRDGGRGATTTTFQAGLVAFSERFVVQRDRDRDVRGLIDDGDGDADESSAEDVAGPEVATDG